MISFDLDMTLLDHQSWQIPQSAWDAIHKLRETHKIVIATGRDMDHAFSLPWKEQLAPDGIVHMNGTKVTVADQVIYQRQMDRDLLKQLLLYCQQKGYGIGATIGELDYYTHHQVIKAHDCLVWGCCDRHFADPFLLLEQPVYTLALIGGQDQAQDIQRQFPRLRLPVFASKAGADVVEAEASKANGLAILAAHWGEPEDLSTCVAFGDSMNDYEMLSACGIGVAMGNAPQQLRQVADYVTTKIHEDGIWNACVELGLIK